MGGGEFKFLQRATREMRIGGGSYDALLSLK